MALGEVRTEAVKESVDFPEFRVGLLNESVSDFL
jgi:hypothetical protein